MSADHGVYCESCGNYIELLDGGPVYVCPTCRVVSCPRCWDPEHGRCVACQALLIAGGSPARPLRGVAAARWTLRELTKLHADTEALRGGSIEPDPSHRSDVDLDLILLGACARTLRAEAESASATASPRSAATLSELVRQQEAEADAIEHALADIRIDRMRRDAQREAPPILDVRQPLVPRARLVRLGVGIAAVLVIAGVIPLIPALSSRLASNEPTSPAATERAGVLGIDRHVPTPEADSTAAPALTLVTFDDWRMTAPIPAEWRVARGSADQVAVAAFPSAMDRSLELMASATGAGVTLCRPVPAGAPGLQVDALIQTADTELLLAMPSDDPSGGQASWLFTTRTTPDTSSATTVPVDVDGWYRFEAEVDSVGARLRWTVLHPGREATGAVAVADGESALSGAMGEVCLTIGDGVPDGRALIDNLMIGQDR